MLEAGVEPARALRPTAPSTLRVYQFHHPSRVFQGGSASQPRYRFVPSCTTASPTKPGSSEWPLQDVQHLDSRCRARAAAARLEGLEPPASGSEDQRSVQLSYRRTPGLTVGRACPRADSMEAALPPPHGRLRPWVSLGEEENQRTARRHSVPPALGPRPRFAAVCVPELAAAELEACRRQGTKGPAADCGAGPLTGGPSTPRWLAPSAGFEPATSGPANRRSLH